MASAVDKVQIRLQEAMDQGNQASLGQAIDASKGVNGLKQLRRSAKVGFVVFVQGNGSNRRQRQYAFAAIALICGFIVRALVGGRGLVCFAS